MGKLQPKAKYCDTILQTRNSLHVSLVAKNDGIAAIRLNRLLHDLGVQYKVGGAWVLYQQHAGKGYTKSRTYYVGDRAANIQTQWTQQGRMFLYYFLAWHGILPSIERESA